MQRGTIAFAVDLFMRVPTHYSFVKELIRVAGSGVDTSKNYE